MCRWLIIYPVKCKQCSRAGLSKYRHVKWVESFAVPRVYLATLQLTTCISGTLQLQHTTCISGKHCNIPHAHLTPLQHTTCISGDTASYHVHIWKHSNLPHAYLHGTLHKCTCMSGNATRSTCTSWTHCNLSMIRL